MSTSDILNNAKKSIQEIIKSIQFKKAVNDRERLVKIQTAHQKCCGVLERSRIEFENIIREQCNQVKIGNSLGQYTDVQEQLLYDAALGYIYIKDAMYAVTSVNNDDSMNYAYNLLDFAVQNLTRKNAHPIKSKITEFKAKRSAFKDQLQEDADAKRAELALAILPELKINGDIETCLKHVRLPEKTEQSIEFSRLSSGLPASLTNLSGTAASPAQTAASQAAAFLDSQRGSGEVPLIDPRTLSTSMNPTGGSNPSDQT